jgi:glutamine synthetase
MTATWSVNNRGSALRIPVSDPVNRRIEHRLAGADANPYLVVAWMLAGIHRGLSRGVEPPPALDGNAYRGSDAEPLPLYWPQALERFAASGFAAEYLGAHFARVYGIVKRSEMEEFHSHVTPLEVERWLGPI